MADKNTCARNRNQQKLNVRSFVDKELGERWTTKQLPNSYQSSIKVPFKGGLYQQRLSSIFDFQVLSSSTDL